MTKVKIPERTVQLQTFHY